MNVQWVMIFCKSFVWNISHSERNSDIFVNVPTSSCKILVILLGFSHTGIFSMIFENSNNNFLEIRPAGVDLFYNWRTDMTKLIVAFRNFTNALKINHIYIFLSIAFRSLARENYDRLVKCGQAMLDSFESGCSLTRMNKICTATGFFFPNALILPWQ
jgi:hypothetical protein